MKKELILERLEKALERLKTSLVHHKHCYLCGQSAAELVCEYCRYDTVIPLLPVPGFDLLMRPNIAEHLVPPYYHHLYALGEYTGILKLLVNRLKFGNQPLAAEVLAGFFMQNVYPRISQLEELPEALVPLPLSKWRYVKRQYNQAQLLAESISRCSEIPIFDCLVRTKHTKAQSGLDREARLRNISHAFALNKAIEYSHIAVIDDVVTTGATINSACRSIVERYPDIQISVWSMAVTPSPTPSKLIFK